MLKQFSNKSDAGKPSLSSDYKKPKTRKIFKKFFLLAFRWNSDYNEL
jgi:hypothetical protein